MANSTPEYESFNPYAIPFQNQVIYDIHKDYDYTKGTHEVFLSGAVGSSKSVLMAWLAIDHCIRNPNAVVGIGRLTMPSLKNTLLDVILKMMTGNEWMYSHNMVDGTIKFFNGSVIRCFSWKDKNYKKVRSYEFSAFFIEEFTENKDMEFYEEILMRVGRLGHVDQKLVVSASNPDDPEHPAYKYFIQGQSETRHVYYSVTKDNPFLPPSYVTQLEETLDPKMARRMLHGEWLSIRGDVIYYAYDKEHNFKRGSYELSKLHPIHVGFDFNISANAPMSYCLGQYINGIFHIYDEVIIETASTAQALEEGIARGLFDQPCLYIIQGDASGKARSTKSIRSDYDIIESVLANYVTPANRRVRYRMDIPSINPPIRERHNRVNSVFENARGARKCFIYEKCKTLDEGLSLTKLKDGAQYLEKEWFAQHVTTALGYMVCSTLNGLKDTSVRFYQR